jgi:hypothetical protein
MAVKHQNNFATNLTSAVSATDTTSPLDSIPTIDAPFYLAFDATNINSHYEVVYVTSKTATNVNHAALSYDHTIAEEVRCVCPAVEMDSWSESLAVSYKFSVWRNDAANTGNGVFAVISFDTEIFDTSNNVSAGVFTVPVNGYYHFDAGANIGAGTVNALSIFVDNVETVQGNFGAPSGNGSYHVSSLLYLTAGQAVDVRAYGNASNAIGVGNKSYTYFTGYLVSTT